MTDDHKIQDLLSAKADELILSAAKAPSGHDILFMCFSVARMLLEKNYAYGDSARYPVRIISSASPEEQIRVRIDDKLSRLVHHGGDAGDPMDEDVLLDLVGYFILLLIVLNHQPTPMPPDTKAGDLLWHGGSVWQVNTNLLDAVCLGTDTFDVLPVDHLVSDGAKWVIRGGEPVA